MTSRLLGLARASSVRVHFGRGGRRSNDRTWRDSNRGDPRATSALLRVHAPASSYEWSCEFTGVLRL